MSFDEREFCHFLFQIKGIGCKSCIICKFDQGFPLPKQCRQIEVLSSQTNISLTSKQMNHRLINYIRIIRNISLFISNITISSEILNSQNYVNSKKKSNL